MKFFSTSWRIAKVSSIVTLLCLLVSCSTVKDWFSSNDHKPGPIPTITSSQYPRIIWQTSVSKPADMVNIFRPAIINEALYVASAGGDVSRIDLLSGRLEWRVQVGSALSAGVGANDQRVIVASPKGDVFALDPASGRTLWTSKLGTEIYTTPLATESLIIIWSGDGRTSALDANTGEVKWTHQRPVPALSVRNYAGGLDRQGNLYFGTAGGKLLSLRLNDGTTLWEESIANPKGATELERIADVTSLPYVDGSQVCAAAFQGKIACFDQQQGSLLWSREFGSFSGVTGDDKYLYVTDDQGFVQAFDKQTGASIWKQDQLASRRPSGPTKLGSWLAVADFEGYYYLLNPLNGGLVGMIASDASAPLSSLQNTGNKLIAQTRKGNVLAIVVD